MSRVIVEKEMIQNRQVPPNYFADKTQYNLSFTMPLQNNFPNINPVSQPVRNQYQNANPPFPPIHELNQSNFVNNFPPQTQNTDFNQMPRVMQATDLPDLPHNPNSVRYFHQDEESKNYSFLNSQFTEEETNKLFEEAENSLGYSYWPIS